MKPDLWTKAALAFLSAPTTRDVTAYALAHEAVCVADIVAKAAAERFPVRKDAAFVEFPIEGRPRQ